MKFTILGSGGCVSLPKPLCKCSVCVEAREKGKPYSRFGCSLFLQDLNLLVDTPEDIVHALNSADIGCVDYVLYSHTDPDHILGMRVFEQLRLNWLEVAKGKMCSDPINLFAMEHVMSDMDNIKSKFGPYFNYYENVMSLVKRNIVKDSICFRDINITFIEANNATVFVFEQNSKKVIYAPCDVKPFPNNPIFENADIMIIGNTIIGDVLKDGYVLTNDNPLTKELFVMNEIEELKAKYNINKVIMTHLEEDWGKSYDDYIELEKQYDNIIFAYDGMSFEIF